MPRLSRLLRFLPALLVALACTAPAAAADVARGQSLYNSICATCHNPGGNPGPDPIKKGAGAPSLIALALRTVVEMSPLETTLTATDVDDLAAYLALRFNVTPVPQTAVAVEYYHQAFDHFFVTAIADEITKLDNGTFAGWQRTGQHFDVYAGGTVGASPVCRFFSTAFGAKSSHFYTASPSECEIVKSNPSWTFEGEVFWVVTPNEDGTCAAGHMPVYRLYNNGMGEAPNHRLTVNSGLQAEMQTMGWIPEGYGIGVTMCAPAPAPE
ncbi:MAG: cytochrome c [Betaproteobacteria bacterium]|nr:cytochrome c [Betaproteobacteria bacterium]MCC7218595.1 cytochrome c [Burkholderiales bacterium]